MWKVNEIFYSLQGEGYNTGIASVFIRLSGCNLHCAFCDTRHEKGTMMSLPEIVDRVMQYPQYHRQEEREFRAFDNQVIQAVDII